MTEAPDIYFNFDAGKIKVRSDGTAVLSGQFTLSGTRMGMKQHRCNGNGTNMGMKQPNVITPDTSSVPDCPWEQLSHDLEVNALLNEAACMTPEKIEYDHDAAHRFEVEGELSMHMDSNFRIELIDMAVALANIIPLPNIIAV